MTLLEAFEGWPVSVIFGVMMLLAALISAYLFYRHSLRREGVANGLLRGLLSQGWAVVVYNLDSLEINHASGLKTLMAARQPFDTVGHIVGMLNEEDRGDFDALIRRQPEEGNELSLLVRTVRGASLECCISLVEWRGIKKRLLLVRSVSKAYGKMLSVRSENEVLKAEARSHTGILNHIPHPMWIRDADLSIRYCNLPYMQILDENDESSDERGMPELFLGARKLAAKALSERATQQVRQTFVMGGERRLFLVTEIYTPTLKGTVGYASDLSCLEAAEAQARDHLSTLEDILGSSSSAMTIYGVDTRLKFFNQAYVRMWGVPEAWLERQPTFGETLERLRELRKLPEQVNFPAFKQQRMRLFTEVTEPQEELFYLPDGRTIRNIAIPHSSGGLLFIYEDVTDRLALERSYNTLIAVQQETLDNLSEAVVVYGEDGKLRLKNPVFLSLWGLEGEDVPEGTHIADVLERTRSLYSATDWEDFKSEFIAQVQSRQRHISRLERSDGAVIDCCTIPLPDGGVLLTYVDMTASTLVERSLRERNEALEAGDKLKTEFLANMSYELRSPLTSITGFAEMLSGDYFGELSPKQSEYVKGIYESSQHLMTLINDILDLSSFEAGYLALNVSEFDIHRLLQATLSLLAERLREYDLSARIDCTGDIGRMHADETRIRQILFHLLSNAVKYSSPGGHIVLGARREDDGITLWVEDNGAGISDEEQQAVFDKFYRGTAGVRRSGSGLGLSMVKSFVEMHGGSVSLASAPGKGTRVTCFIPSDTQRFLHDAHGRIGESNGNSPSPNPFAIEGSNTIH